MAPAKAAKARRDADGPPLSDEPAPEASEGRGFCACLGRLFLLGAAFAAGVACGFGGALMSDSCSQTDCGFAGLLAAAGAAARVGPEESVTGTACDARVAELGDALRARDAAVSAGKTERDEILRARDERAAEAAKAVAELEQLRVSAATQARELAVAKAEVTRLQGRGAAAAEVTEAEVERLREPMSAADEATASTEPTPSGEEVLADAEPALRNSAGGWPQCMEQGVVLRGAGVHALFVDASGVVSNPSRCWLNNCRSTDKFEAADPEACASVCATVEGCAFWTHGEQDGAAMCFLRTGDGGRAALDGFVAGTRSCAPPRGEERAPVHPAQVALAVLDSEALRSCDGGSTGPNCPDLHDAMRTWRYGLLSALAAFEGQPGDAKKLIDQVLGDTDYLLSLPHDHVAQNYGVVEANSRQLLEALRPWLSKHTPVPLDVGDDSLSRPARGLLCQGACEP